MHPLFGQDALFQTIRDSYSNVPHLFITGPAGCGKTTFLETCIQMFKTEAPFEVESVLYLSSEKDRGIHTIRDKINDYCKRGHAKPNCLRFIVIDDADALPQGARAVGSMQQRATACNSVQRSAPQCKGCTTACASTNTHPQRCPAVAQHNKRKTTALVGLARRGRSAPIE